MLISKRLSISGVLISPSVVLGRCFRRTRANRLLAYNLQYLRVQKADFTEDAGRFLFKVLDYLFHGDARGRRTGDDGTGACARNHIKTRLERLPQFLFHVREQVGRINSPRFTAIKREAQCLSAAPVEGIFILHRDTQCVPPLREASPVHADANRQKRLLRQSWKGHRRG